MDTKDILKRAEALVEKVEGTKGDLRHALHAELHGLLRQLKIAGASVPAHLRELDLELEDEEVEEGFDNMPV